MVLKGPYVVPGLTYKSAAWNTCSTTTMYYFSGPRIGMPRPSTCLSTFQVVNLLDNPKVFSEPEADFLLFHLGLSSHHANPLLSLQTHICTLGPQTFYLHIHFPALSTYPAASAHTKAVVVVRNQSFTSNQERKSQDGIKRSPTIHNEPQHHKPELGMICWKRTLVGKGKSLILQEVPILENSPSEHSRNNITWTLTKLKNQR